jgi:hypothetical protein
MVAAGKQLMPCSSSGYRQQVGFRQSQSQTHSQDQEEAHRAWNLRYQAMAMGA